jgi:glycine cleavage system aminomethyltransferase T
MAYLPPSLSTPGTVLEVEVRGRGYAAVVTTLPFYSK